MWRNVPSIFQPVDVQTHTEGDFDQYIDREWVEGPVYPHDPTATGVIADQKEMARFRNVPSVFQPVDL